MYVYIYIYIFHLLLSLSLQVVHGPLQLPALPASKTVFFPFPSILYFFFQTVFQSAMATKERKCLHWTRTQSRGGKVSGSEGKGCAFQMGFAGDFL